MSKKRIRKRNRGLYLFTRIFAIVFISLLGMLSLDIFDMHLGFWGTILGLIIHNIPSLILLVALILSWKKYEIVGGITFILAGLIYAILARRLLWGVLIITGPALLIGILFLIEWFRKK